MSALLVRSGTLVGADSTLEADVLCEDGKISAIVARGASVRADEVLDANGMLVFPGFIDPHVHSRDPGHTHKETFWHSTLGSLCGGVTTVLEMPNAVPPVSDLETFLARRDAHAVNAWVDFGLWGMALGEANTNELRPMLRAGAVAIKLFWGYALHEETKTLVYNFRPDAADELLLPPDNGEVLEIFEEVAAAGGVLAAHCEDRHILARSAQNLGHPITTYDDLLAARPAIAEAAAIALGAQFSREAGCRFHVVHMASALGATVVREAQRTGIRITAETCPQYLTLTDADASDLGPLIKVYPPVRHQADQDALWCAINDGTVGTVGSDHAPHLVDEKMVGFADAPAGGLGVETLAPLILHEMLAGRISSTRTAAILSTNTARLYGLWPHKGSLRPGTDADLTIVDPASTTHVRNDRLHALNPVSTWDGRQLRGRIVASVLAGTEAMRDGEPVGARRGRFVAADHARGRPPKA